MRLADLRRFWEVRQVRHRDHAAPAVEQVRDGHVQSLCDVFQFADGDTPGAVEFPAEHGIGPAQPRGKPALVEPP